MRHPASTKRHGVPLTVSIFSILVLSVAVVAGSLIAHGFMSARNTTRDIGGALLTSIAERTAGEVLGVMESASALAALASQLPDLARVPDLQRHPATSYLMAALDTYPSLYSAYMGFADGRFYQIIDLSAEQGRAGTLHQAPPDARFLQRAILNRADGGRMELWSFLDHDGRLLGSSVRRVTDYDPRLRPWYLGAVKVDRVITTPIYRFATLGLPGMTVARRFDGPVPGVFGVDLTVGDLSRFLDRQRVTPNARLAVIAGDGAVLAVGGLSPSSDDGAGAAEVPSSMADIRDPTLAAASGLPLAPGVARLTVDGAPVLADVRRVSGAHDLDLRVLVVAPEADFVQPLLAMRDRGLLFAAGVLAIALPLAWLVSHRMAAALSHVAEQADRIRSLDLAEARPVRSFVREIQALAGAMTTMTASLRTFGLYVPKALVGQIVDGGGDVELGGSRHEVTLLFTDVADFTTLAETTPPEDLLIRTSMLFEEIGAAITAHSGIIDKFIGDAVMALWNVPSRTADHARLACLAALEADRRVAIFNQELTANGYPPMPTRFGIHTGFAVVGNVGSSDRMNYTAVGAAVNMASRLEGLNKVFGTRILISRPTAEQAGADFVVRWLACVQPKGATEVMDVFALVGLHKAAAADLGIPWASVSDVDADFIRRWNAAQHLLRRDGNRAAATAAFAALAAERPDDPIARTAAVETATLLADPAGSTWSGTLFMSEK